MFYLYFAIFSLGAAMLQSSYLRAGKGIVRSNRRITYTVLAVLVTCIQILVGSVRVDSIAGALLFIPIFYIVNKVLRATSLRLRYTFRIGLALVLLTAYPIIYGTWTALAP